MVSFLRVPAYIILPLRSAAGAGSAPLTQLYITQNGQLSPNLSPKWTARFSSVKTTPSTIPSSLEFICGVGGAVDGGHLQVIVQDGAGARTSS